MYEIFISPLFGEAVEFIWQMSFFFIPVHKGSLLSDGRAPDTPSLLYIRCISALQLYVIIQFMGLLITFPFHKILH